MLIDYLNFFTGALNDNDLNGIKNPYLYFGMWRSTFGTQSFFLRREEKKNVEKISPTVKQQRGHLLKKIPPGMRPDSIFQPAHNDDHLKFYFRILDVFKNLFSLTQTCFPVNPIST